MKKKKNQHIVFNVKMIKNQISVFQGDENFEMLKANHIINLKR